MSSAASSRLQWIASLLVPLAFIHVLLFLRIPTDIYLASPDDHTAALQDILPFLALFGLGSLACTALLATALGWRIPGDVRVLLIALAFTYWAADSFLGRSYPQLDGTVLRIDTDRLRLVLEFAIFIGALLFLEVAPRRAAPAALLFLGLLTLFNLGSVLTATKASPGAPADASLPIAAEEPFELSAERNVLVLVLDTLQSDYVNEVFEREPELRDAFDGFVTFPDTLGVAPTTSLSLPAIHSGRYYDPERSMSGYFETAIRNNSFLSGLADSGYRAILVNPIRNACPRAVACTGRDALLRGRAGTVMKEVLHLLDISLMRSAPEPLKNRVFNSGRFRLSPLFTAGQLTGDARVVWDDERVLAQITGSLAVGAEQPAALFLHLMSTHPPYVLEGDCSVRADAVRLDREAAVAQATCVVRQLSRLIGTLHELGVHDRTLIVVLADHGYSSREGPAELESRRVTPSEEAEALPARLIGGANPLLMTKPPGGSGPLRTSSAPASLVDVAATVCAVEGACTAGDGVNLLAADAPSERARRYMHYIWEHRFWEVGYVEEADFYEVTGPLPERNSWYREEHGLRRHRIERIDASASGKVLSFGAGWDEAEPDTGSGSKRWAVSHVAELFALLKPDPERDVAFQIDLEFYTPEFIRDQSVSLVFNGNPISERVLENRMQRVSFRLPARLAVPGSNRIELRFAQLVRPEGFEKRTLATSLFVAMLSEVERRPD